jgi:hypothetical protein
MQASLERGDPREYLDFSSQFFSDMLTGLTMLRLLVGFAAVVWTTLLGETTTKWLTSTRPRRRAEVSQSAPPSAHS